MLLFTDFYDIQRPVKIISLLIISAVVVNDDNLITAMECVTKLEKVESCKEIANSLEEKCVKFFERQYRSAKAVGSFVSANIDNINLVNRLLVKSTNLNTGESTCMEVTSRKPCSRCKKISMPIRHCQNIPAKCLCVLLCGNCRKDEFSKLFNTK